MAIDREREPIVALARELRLAAEEHRQTFDKIEQVLDISTDDLEKPLLARAQAAKLFVAAVREADAKYITAVEKALDRYESRTLSPGNGVT